MKKEISHTDDHDFAIWPPYEVFYIESMLQISSFAVQSSETLKTIHHDKEIRKDITPDDIINLLQNIVTQAAALSRYFWPVKKKSMHKKRAEHLCRAFEVTDDSALKNRELRNQIEHFDENIDIYFSETRVGNIIPQYVGRFREGDGVPQHYFRAYYTDLGIFEVLGKQYEIQPIIDEIYRVHNDLVRFTEAGYRLKREWINK